MKVLTIISSMENPQFVFQYIQNILGNDKSKMNNISARKIVIKRKVFLSNRKHNILIRFQFDSVSKYDEYVDSILNYYEDRVPKGKLRENLFKNILYSNVQVSITCTKDMDKNTLKQCYRILKKMNGIGILEDTSLIDCDGQLIVDSKGEFMNNKFMPNIYQKNI